MRKKAQKEHSSEMYEAILKLKDLDECREFFEDLCAATERSAMEQRFHVAMMLRQDRVYMDIMEESNTSSATISRVNRVLNDGTGVLADKIDELLAEKDGNQTEEGR